MSLHTVCPHDAGFLANSHNIGLDAIVGSVSYRGKWRQHTFFVDCSNSDDVFGIGRRSDFLPSAFPRVTGTAYKYHAFGGYAGCLT